MSHYKNKSLLLFTALIITALALSGCAKDVSEYKSEADKEVYDIVEKNWDDQFGSRANYKINDVSTSFENTEIKKLIPPSGVISLQRAVAIATAQNRQYQTEKELLYIKALDQTLVRHQFEPSFFLNSKAAYFAGDDEEVFAAASTTGLDRLLYSGARFSTNMALAWSDILTGDMKSGLSSIFSAAITQPLLRGSQRDLVIESLTQAQRDTLYQVRSFNRFRKEFVVSVISQYYNVLLQHQLTKNAHQNYFTHKKSLASMEKMAAAGRLPNHELQQARQDILEARDIHFRQEKLYKHALDEFKLTLSLPVTLQISLDPEELASLSVKIMSQPDFTEDQAVSESLKRRLDLLNMSDAIADFERKVALAADGFGAELNLTAATRTSSRSTTDITGFGRTDSANSLALELDLPLDRKAERNEYRKALIALERSKRNYDQHIDIVTLQIRNAYRDLNEAAGVRLVQLESLDLAAHRANNTELLLQYGRANTRDILDAQEDLFKAKNASARALVDFTIATLNFYRDAGVITVKPDGMWSKVITPEKQIKSGHEEIIADWIKMRKSREPEIVK